jgi:hypothetical protein
MSPGEMPGLFIFLGAEKKRALYLGMRNIYQGDEEGCGLSSLRSLLCLKSHQRGYRYLPLEGHPPYSLERLRQAAAREGLVLSFKRVRGEKELAGNRKWPLLLLLGPETDSHMVLARGRLGRYLLVDDPSEGRHYRRIKDLNKSWNGIYGEVVSYQSQKCPYHKPSLGEQGRRYLALLMGVLSQIALYIGFYFMGEESGFYGTLSALTSAMLLEIAERFFSVRAMKHFDSIWLLRIDDPDPEVLKKNYQHYYAFKKGLNANWLRFFSAFLFFVSLSMLVGWNNPSFFACVAGLAGYLFLEASIFSKAFHRAEKELESRERLLFHNRLPQELRRSEILSLASQAYRLGDYLGYGQAIGFAIVLALSFIPSAAAHDFSLNYYLFHFFALYSIAGALREVYDFFENREKQEGEYDYFLEYFVKKSSGE